MSKFFSDIQIKSQADITNYSGALAGPSYGATIKADKKIMDKSGWNLRTGVGLNVASAVSNSTFATAYSPDFYSGNIAEGDYAGDFYTRTKTLTGMLGPVSPVASFSVMRQFGENASLGVGVSVRGNGVTTSHEHDSIYMDSDSSGTYTFSVQPDTSVCKDKKYGATVDIDALSLRAGALTLSAGPSIVLNSSLNGPTVGVRFAGGLNLSQMLSRK